MQLDFVSVEEFYFALTLDTRLLYEWHDPALVEQVRLRLKAGYGEPSTVAAARQNTFNYVFRVIGNLPANTLIEVLDWGEQLRLNSNYGLERTPGGKVNRLPAYEERPQFAAAIAATLAQLLHVPLIAD
ncbi:hypothetical protein [Gloeobacter violaceus]|uniref:Gll0873 protein n=1 Tax=Gloeobacter violaceus (strain ATCC 29082 / PCC 7421) TaxID=251221 RepID=Q7NM94_GLOVI|nr:hypothetical protein [Gloeobacter violaceus]BAC88814.1 gll0873 [Gloeobacter violaceus PCC 7421]